MKGRLVNGRLQHFMRGSRSRAALLFLCINCLAFYTPAWTQTEIADCAKLLDQAENQYYQGHFDQAIQIAENCLTRRDLPEDLEIRSHKIIAKASVSKRHVDRAKEELRKIIEIDPKITLDPDLEPPQVIRLFEEVRKEKEAARQAQPQPQPPVRKPTPEAVKREDKKEKGWFARNWYVVAGGAVATGVGVALLAGGGDPPQVLPLPQPPSFP